MPNFPKPRTEVYLNGKLVNGVRSVDIRISVQEVQQATVVLLCNDIRIDEDGTIHLTTDEA